MINSGGINSREVNWGSVAVVYDVAETAVIVSAVRPQPSEDVAETALITSPAPVIHVAHDVAETAVATNPALVLLDSADITDTAVLSDVAYASNTTNEDVTEVAVLSDTALLSATTIEDAAETAVLNDTIYQPTPTVDVAETAVAASSTAVSISGVLNVAETATVTSLTYPGQYALVAETAVAVSATDYVNTSVLDIAETAVVASADVLYSSNILDIAETAVAASAAVNRADVVTDTAEEGFISSEVYISAHADVWTANTLNWAMSTYTGLTLTGASGAYAVSEDGLFLQGATYANMNMATGESDLGSPYLKAVPYAYVYVEHVAPMGISVTAHASGAEQTSAYTQMARIASDTRAVRCTIGRGFRSSYYKLNFTSTGYAQARECIPVVDELGRRI